MIYCKVPLRISFVGGGTDHINYSKNVGSVISISIDKFVYVFLNKSWENSYKLSYSKKENVSSINQINHPIFRECLKIMLYDGLFRSSDNILRNILVDKDGILMSIDEGDI